MLVCLYAQSDNFCRSPSSVFICRAGGEIVLRTSLWLEVNLKNFLVQRAGLFSSSITFTITKSSLI